MSSHKASTHNHHPIKQSIMALTNDQLAKKYKISPFGGINRCNARGVYVLKINDSSVYDDKVYSDVIQYVGQGLKGDQTFTRNNRGLANSNWPCHVWKRGEDGMYRKIGEYYVDFWYWETQGGRRVIVFQLVKYNLVTPFIVSFLLVLLMVLFNPITISHVYARCTWDGAFCEGGNSTQPSHYSNFPIMKGFYE